MGREMKDEVLRAVPWWSSPDERLRTRAGLPVDSQLIGLTLCPKATLSTFCHTLHIEHRSTGSPIARQLDLSTVKICRDAA